MQISSKTCPANFLGRDVMGVLAIKVVPTIHGLKPIWVNETMVWQRSGVPQYYYVHN